MEDVRIMRVMRAVKDLGSISRNNKKRIEARRMVPGPIRDTVTLRNQSSQGVKLNLGMNEKVIEMNHGR